MSIPLVLPPSNKKSMNVDVDDDDNDDDSFSSDSDDEFLTLRGDGKDVDREALVRKKLLESFYGKSDGDSDSSSDDSEDSNDALNSTDDDEDDDDFDGNGNVSRRIIARRRRRRKNRSKGNAISISANANADVNNNDNTDDLDSTHFDVAKHTQRYVLNSNVYPLLEKEEMLACQVRTLDSSMQTLVYENYSRFIEATDAIRNIGVNVQYNAGNLKKLSTSVIVAGESARDVETTCGKLRDSVVEKLRTKRLLQRLESLLKLPKTLRENIDAGRYRWATKSYLTAYAILNKQSDGFESLQRIEEECYTIMEALLEEVKNKLIQWSGNKIANEEEEVLLDNDDVDKNAQDCELNPNDDDINPTISASRSSLSMEDPPDPPETVADIFECAGTPVLILNHQKQHISLKLKNPIIATTRTSPSSAGRRASQVAFKTGLSAIECQEMSLDACLRLIERFLDTHHFELQEALFASSSSVDVPMDSNIPETPGVVTPQSSGEGCGSGGSRLIPTNVLDSILEASALYSVTFPTDNGQYSERLSQFVSTAFYSFLQHVRGALLEQSTQTIYPKDLQRRCSNGGESTILNEGGNSILVGMREEGHEDKANDIVDDDDDDDEGQETEDKAYEHVANATALLLESVQQFSSGLALPEVAIDEELTSSLVDQTVELSEAMVRRRVDQKFFILRFRVIQNCLAPFCRNALREAISIDAAELKESMQERIDRVVQMASVALSDSSQLVDDTVRSILSSNSNETSTLKTAVEQSTARFAVWLAAAMETLAGCESSEPKHVLDVMPKVPEDDDGDIGAAKTEITSTNLIFPLYLDTYDNADNDLAELVENCMSELLEELDGLGTKAATSDLTLAIAEMCRLAERSVMDDINQSIAIHTGSINKHRSAQTDCLFATTALEGQASSDTTKNNPTSMRFRLAASRVLVLYAMSRGNEGAELLSSDLFELSWHESGEAEKTGPRVGAWSLLTVVKSSAFDCADLFGCPKRAGPIPEVLEDEYASFTLARQKQAFRSSLVVDVERMFEEKVVVYPHPFESFEFQRNLVIVLVLKVAFKSLREDVRLVRFSNTGYRQLLIDVEFLKFMLPHYVNDEFLTDGSNTINVLESLLTEIIKNAKERCDSSAMLQDDCLEINQARAVIRDFMATNGDDDGLVSRFTIVDDDGDNED
mmetsp:Transcript_2439/g.2692  ORF Transcript_2439/g.2692 Transcript_2439/m.2692 type:complete len:1170 (+) Transcript_2439:111-3620(+)